MALRNLTTRTWGPAAAYALRRHPGGPGVPPPPPPPPAFSRFLGTTRGQNDIATWRTSIDVELIRDLMRRFKNHDEIVSKNMRWESKFYKTLEWYSYAVLSVSVAGLTACEVIIRSREDKGHVRPT